ncbi:NADPH-dependent oxidoreductase [Pseudochelatococcus lubricantis]|uniref:NADPH-dependent oxidoreductase n=1 Tax=Pseudochelatococcus lubricantis TaxID=1538102 RepID=UPI0035E6145A
MTRVSSAAVGDEGGSGVASLLAERYGEARPADILSNAVIGQLLNHRSVRAFVPDTLPENVIETLVAAAQSASTSSNLQVWSVVAVENPAHKAELAALAGDQDFIRQAPLFLVWLADLSRVRALGEAHEVTVEGTEFLESLVLGVVDATLAAQNAVVALESLGLGSVYVGAIRNRPLEVAESLKLPPYVFPVFGLAIGYPDPQRPASVKPRLPQAAVLHRETYDASRQPQAVETYDRVLDAFWKGQAQEHPSWSQHVLSRLGRAQALKGRDRLFALARALGFPLR